MGKQSETKLGFEQLFRNMFLFVTYAVICESRPKSNKNENDGLGYAEFIFM